MGRSYMSHRHYDMGRLARGFEIQTPSPALADRRRRRTFVHWVYEFGFVPSYTSTKISICQSASRPLPIARQQREQYG